ncbi:uncharacterized protein LOC112688678 [Sipha flava]|uniref:U8-agatoxin-Ao1a n=1 Tax=Sipha flava TaxID=143950 RepID=A0A2S2QQY5_9HEMI|nr:uncharacterized protein LOC112688678 [Sipha flava]
MKYFITICVVLCTTILLLENTSTASPLDNYPERDFFDEDGTPLLTDLEEYMDKDNTAEDEDLIYGVPDLDVQKRKLSIFKFRKSCVPRGGNCDHRPKYCCNGGSCRCNLWGVNCKCQRMGFFQKWGK